MNSVKQIATIAPPAATRRDQHKRELRQAILDAAGSLFLAEGYDGVSMRRIADQIGYTPTTIYLHFKNRDELLLALLEDGYARFGQALAEAAASRREPLRRLAAIGQAYIAFGLANPMHYQLMFMRRADFLQASLSASREGRVDSFGVLRDAVQAALEAGAIRRADVMTHSLALWSLVHGIVALAVMMPREMFDAAQMERVGELALQTFLKGLRIDA
jgi:AcrR family transcriptional regulator